MPQLDGIEAARRILDERPIPIVMLTAYGQQRARRPRGRGGVFGYLVKPFREQDLLPAIQTARARHEELSAMREEAESLAEALAARKAIERAKGLLMAKEGLSEAGRLRAAPQGEPGLRPAAARHRRGRRRHARRLGTAGAGPGGPAPARSIREPEARRSDPRRAGRRASAP